MMRINTRPPAALVKDALNADSLSPTLYCLRGLRYNSVRCFPSAV
jgi:hypothetical protein